MLAQANASPSTVDLLYEKSILWVLPFSGKLEDIFLKAVLVKHPAGICKGLRRTRNSQMKPSEGKAPGTGWVLRNALLSS